MQGAWGPCITGHSVMIHDRGGYRRQAQLVEVQMVRWERTLSDISGATVVISGRACEAQAEVLTGVDADRHELVLFRGGVRVWEGPIRQVSWFADRCEIVARDVITYLDATPLSKPWPNSDGGGPTLMTERIEEIIEYELTTPYDMTVGTGGAAHVVTVDRWETIDTPANIITDLEVRPSSTLLTRSDTDAFQMSVREHLHNLAEGGLDYTAIGRKVLIWDSAESIGRTRTLTEADFYGEPVVYESGTDYASIVHISAERQEEETEPAVGNAGEVDPYYGPWTKIVSLSSEDGSNDPTQDELNTQAQRNWRTASAIPLEIDVPSSTGIRLDDTLGINDLVPGAEVPVIATLNLRPVSQLQRITRVAVEETPDGESVAMSLDPAGEVGVL